MTKADDEGIRAVREIREEISTECANDPKTLVEHLVAQQEQYRERLLHGVASQSGDTANDT